METIFSTQKIFLLKHYLTKILQKKNYPNQFDINLIFNTSKISYLMENKCDI